VYAVGWWAGALHFMVGWIQRHEPPSPLAH
jgi:hypothetical protein